MQHTCAVSQPRSQGGSDLKRRTLWDALDRDRGKAWYYAAYLGLGLGLVGLTVWLWGFSDWSARGLKVVVQAVGGVASVATLPLVRRKAARNAARSLGSVIIPHDLFPETASVLHDIAVAAGEPVPPLSIFASGALNAFLADADGVTRVAVSTAFTSLPIAEQRAAFAMLLGRRRVAIDGVLLGSWNTTPTDGDGAVVTRVMLEHNAALRRRVANGYVEAASAGDREALMLLKEPGPLFTLLARLADSDRVVPHIEVPAVHLCLAWPFAAEAHSGAQQPALSFEARQKLAERFGVANADLGDPDYQRLQRLQLVVPAAETLFKAPEPIAALQRDTAADEAERERMAADREARRTAAASAAAAAATARQQRLREAAAGPRVAVRCPKCGASNAPVNHRCIACDTALGH